ncbi:MAG: phosphodiester glycosidase family protein [Anaerolineae bacterium]|nr:phosphodiester glycosidase family protein [Anaerolineae bacterium]
MSAAYRTLAFFYVVLSLVACNMPAGPFGATPVGTRTPLPDAEASATPSPLPPSATPSPEWEELLPGFDLRSMEMWINGIDMPVDVVVARIDPDQFVFRVHYSPMNPGEVSDWQRRLGALLVVNGGFFQTNNQPRGLIVVDGQRFGTSFDHHGGMLTVSDDTVSIRSLAQFPYKSEEHFNQAVQCSPMILYPGGFPNQFDDIAPDLSRRTAVAQDTQGRIVFIVVDEGVASLYQLRDWMVEQTDLDLFVAFNLDGGYSTGLELSVGERSLSIASRSKIPYVIAVYPR